MVNVVEMCLKRREKRFAASSFCTKSARSRAISHEFSISQTSQCVCYGKHLKKNPAAITPTDTRITVGDATMKFSKSAVGQNAVFELFFNPLLGSIFKMAVIKHKTNHCKKVRKGRFTIIKQLM